MLKTHLVTRFDSMRRLAVEYLGSASRWPEIAALNGLDDAELEGLVGTEILIPVALEEGRNQDPYLIDLAIEDGDLVLENGDLKTIGGRDNLAASLSRAFVTRPGQLREHPSFGFDLDRYAAEAGSSIHPLLIKHEAEQLFRADPRVREVKEVEVQHRPGSRWVTVAAVVVDVFGKAMRFKKASEE